MQWVWVEFGISLSEATKEDHFYRHARMSAPESCPNNSASRWPFAYTMVETAKLNGVDPQA